MTFRIARDGDRVLLVAQDDSGEGYFPISPAQARFLSAELLGAAAAADPAGHQAMIEEAARGLAADALLAAAPTTGSH